MGGPADLDDIQPFLYKLFSDKDIVQFPIPFMQTSVAWLISKFRGPKVAEHYKKIGGGSPILEITLKQASAIETELTKYINCRVYVGMRYTKPTISTAIDEILKDRPQELIVLPLYPHYSFSTTLSAFNELQRVMDKNKMDIPITKIENWYDYPDYIYSICTLIKKKLKTFPDKDKVQLLFSAHSVPVSYIDKGDPYSQQITECVDTIVDELSCPNFYHISYQSKVGPIKWLEPTTEETIENIAKLKDQDILVIPISFVSDHFETSYEIDMVYAELARQLEIRHFKRIDSLNDHSFFIKALCNLLLDYMKGGSQ